MKKILAILSFVAFGSLGASAGEIEITCCDGTQTCVGGLSVIIAFIYLDEEGFDDYINALGKDNCPNGCWKSVSDSGPTKIY